MLHYIFIITRTASYLWFTGSSIHVVTDIIVSNVWFWLATCSVQGSDKALATTWLPLVWEKKKKIILTVLLGFVDKNEQCQPELELNASSERDTEGISELRSSRRNTHTHSHRGSIVLAQGFIWGQPPFTPQQGTKLISFMHYGTRQANAAQSRPGCLGNLIRLREKKKQKVAACHYSSTWRGDE